MEKKCYKCKNVIPFLEKVCLWCGAKQVNPLLWVALLSIFVIIGILLLWGGEKSNTSNKKTPITLEQKIEKQFTQWDGSHIKLKAYVKDNLKDPSSFEHIKTIYTPNPSVDNKGEQYITVTMEYRAKNSFWGYVVERYKAYFDIEGNPFKIEEWGNI